MRWPPGDASNFTMKRSENMSSFRPTRVCGNAARRNSGSAWCGSRRWSSATWARSAGAAAGSDAVAAAPDRLSDRRKRRNDDGCSFAFGQRGPRSSAGCARPAGVRGAEMARGHARRPSADRHVRHDTQRAAGVATVNVHCAFSASRVHVAHVYARASVRLKLIQIRIISRVQK